MPHPYRGQRLTSLRQTKGVRRSPAAFALKRLTPATRDDSPPQLAMVKLTDNDRAASSLLPHRIESDMQPVKWRRTEMSKFLPPAIITDPAGDLPFYPKTSSFLLRSPVSGSF
jgi:hypothetical protein